MNITERLQATYDNVKEWPDKCTGADFRIMNEAAAEILHLRALNKDAHDIIDRIWAIFGTPSYEELAGRTIYDLVQDSSDGIMQIAVHLDCEPDTDSILHTIREIQADLEIAKEAAPASAPEPVQIKQLTWRAYGNQNLSGWQGQGPMGYLRYVTNRGPDGEEGWWCDDEVFDTADQAKAAAQADFEARIRSALVTT